MVKSKLRSRFSRIILSSLLVLSFASLPLTTYAEAGGDGAAEAPICTPPPDTQPGVHRPVGADANTYTYNCDTGMWENAHYTFNPANSEVTPKDPRIYVCDPATGHYNVNIWIFNAPNNNYVESTQTVSQPPASAKVVACPPPPAAEASTNSNSALSNPSDPNSINNSINNSADLNNTTNAIIANLLNSTATTGNALVLRNTRAGDATSGDASVLATQMNLLQSSTSFGLNGEPVTFVANIDGDVNGDFLFDPATLNMVQPATANTSLNGDLDINSTTNATMNNTFNLNAGSGNATVASNTTAGSATSGNATAIANLVNIINSALTAGKSFIGVVNINGNLNGDILLPPNFIDMLIASNVPTVTLTAPDSSNSNTTVNNSTTVNNTNNQGINNNVNANASSGLATVDSNTTAGNATSGNASTHITAFNLTGSNVIGTNDLLVFVNVLGKWVGLIVNAPAGATAAELGGGISQNTIVNGDATVNNTTNQQINNDININAHSGDALVSRNTTAGNATSGAARAAVNLLNVENSSLSLAGWFGILFINVFGNWFGSFGVNTDAGNPPATDSVQATVQTFRFVPHGSGGTNFAVASVGGSGGTVPTTDDSVLAAHTATLTDKSAAPTPQISTTHHNLLLPIISITLFITFLALERFAVRKT